MEREFERISLKFDAKRAYALEQASNPHLHTSTLNPEPQTLNPEP